MAVMYKVEGLPASVRVGPFDIALTVQPTLQAAAEGNYGSFNSMNQEIRLQETFAHWSKAVDTLIHEVLHAIYWVYCIEGKDDEERTVSTLATGLLAFFRDNPAVSAWAFQHMKPGAA